MNNNGTKYISKQIGRLNANSLHKWIRKNELIKCGKVVFCMKIKNITQFPKQ